MGRTLSGDHRRKISDTLKHRYANGEIQVPVKPPELLTRMSVERTGEGNPMYGRHQPEDVRERIGAAARGKKHSAEWKKNISEARLNSELVKRCPVYQFTKTGELVGNFKSMKEAQEQTGFASTNISACCRGKHKQAYGFIWCYQDKPETFPSPIEGLSS